MAWATWRDSVIALVARRMPPRGMAYGEPRRARHNISDIVIVSRLGIYLAIDKRAASP